MTLTAEDTVALVGRLYDLTGAGEWDAAAALLTDDFTITEAGHLPMACALHGKDALRQLYMKVFTLVDVVRLETLADCVGGNHCVRLLKLHFAGEGLEPVEIAETFELRGSQVCRIKPYYYNPDAFAAAVAHKAALAAV